MDEEQILDNLKEKPITKNGIRPLAIVMELIPFIFLLIGVASLNYSLFLILIFPTWYLLFSWYFFKASDYKVLDIIVAEIGVMIPVLGFLGILFKIESWAGGSELVLIAVLLGFILSAYLLFRFIYKKDDPLEYRFSLKLFSRVIVCTGIFAFLLIRYF